RHAATATSTFLAQPVPSHEAAGRLVAERALKTILKGFERCAYRIAQAFKPQPGGFLLLLDVFRQTLWQYRPFHKLNPDRRFPLLTVSLTATALSGQCPGRQVCISGWQ